MKYQQLTKEQFEELHQEFAKFLATQQIDAKEWNQIKVEKPHLAVEEMKIFSDIVWENVLTKTKYLEHFSKNTINLFECDTTKIHRIVVTITKKVNLLEEDGYQWLLDNLNDKSVELFTGTKNYTTERNIEIFDLIKKGSIITEGNLFLHFKKVLKK